MYLHLDKYLITTTHHIYTHFAKNIPSLEYNDVVYRSMLFIFMGAGMGKVCNE